MKCQLTVITVGKFSKCIKKILEFYLGHPKTLKLLLVFVLINDPTNTDLISSILL